MSNSAALSNYTLDQLKILIVSTPKTGNTWLRHLLAVIYDLPSAKLDFPFRPAAADALGSRWIAHQHYAIAPDLLDWARRRNAILITTARHPGDVLLSLYHYVRVYNEKFAFYQLAELGADDGTFGAPVHSVLHTTFKDLSAITADWAASGAAHVVKYEDLFFDPVETLTALTDRIIPVGRDAIERAIERCDIRVMRTLADENSSFFRQGGYGGWRTELPPDIIDLLRTTAPYPAHFATLGYTLAADDAWTTAAVKRPTARADFFERFGHSPATTALLKTIYLSFDSAEAQRRWPHIASATLPTSFHLWLNAPAEDDPAPATLPPITNLVAQIHHIRPDLRALFPDRYGQHRVDVALWFMLHAQRTYQLDDTLMAPLRDWFVRWATQPDAADPAGALPDADLPLVTHLVSYLYQRRADVYQPFPDLYGQHRLDVLFWMWASLRNEYHLDEQLTAPLREALLRWATMIDPASRLEDHAPALTQLVRHVYTRRADLQTAFPDLYGANRLDLIFWMLTHAAREYQLDDAFVAPLRQQLLAWATQPDPRDPRQPALTNLVTATYTRRADLQATFPDPYGANRLDLIFWMLAHLAREYQIDDAFVAPLRQQLLTWAMRSSGSGMWLTPRFAVLSRYLLERGAITHGRTVVVLQCMVWLVARFSSGPFTRPESRR